MNSHVKAQTADRPGVLFITRNFPPATGGLERLADDLQRALQPYTHLFLVAWGGSNVMLVVVLPWFFVRSCWLLLTKPIDVIHSFDGVVSIICVPLKYIFRKPLYTTVHGLDVTYSNKLFQYLIRWSLSHADRVVCLSRATKDEVLKRGVDPAKVTIIPLGITDDLYMRNRLTARKGTQKLLPELTEQSQIILSVGRLVERKGVQWFIASVLPKVIKTHPHVVFVVIGDGPMRPAIEKEIRIRRLQQHVFLLGRASDATARLFYNAADCFVMPNIRVSGDMEGFGRVLPEAALCQLPIIASGIEGIVDAITNGENGQLLKPKQTKDYVEALQNILNNPTQARKRGEKARRYTWAKFNWTVVASQHVAGYRELLKEEVT